MEGGFFLWRVKFFKIGRVGPTFIRETRVQLRQEASTKSWGFHDKVENLDDCMSEIKKR